MNRKRFNLRDRARSFKYAGRGIARLIGKEHNAWIHCAAAVCVVVAGFFFRLSGLEWVAIVLCIGAVFAAEGFNSAIEALCDRVTPEYDEDLAAGAVLILAVMSVIVGLTIFVPKIILLFGK